MVRFALFLQQFSCHWDLVFYLFLRQGLTSCPGWPWTQRSRSICLLSVETKGVCPHAWLDVCIFSLYYQSSLHLPNPFLVLVSLYCGQALHSRFHWSCIGCLKFASYRFHLHSLGLLEMSGVRAGKNVVQFPAPTLWFITILNSSSRGVWLDFFWLPWAPGTRCTSILADKTVTYV